MTLLGWYAKKRMKYLVVFLLLTVIFWYVFIREWNGFDTDFCYEDRCKIKTAYGKDSRGGNCFGRKCVAGNCVGEDCRAGDCSGFNCKAGDCYGLNCTPGRCNDPTCKKKKDTVKGSPTFGQEIGCTQGKCADGRAYEIKRGKLRKYLKHFPENTTYNQQFCNTIMAVDQMKKSGTKESKIWKPDMKIDMIRYYHKGWLKSTYKKPKRKEGAAIILQKDPIIDSIPLIYKGDNCQWCTKTPYGENCSDYKPKHETEMTGPNKDIIKDKWSWEPGKEFGCFPRDSDGIVVNCKQRPSADGRITVQHEMVQIDNNTFKCRICGKVCNI